MRALLSFFTVLPLGTHTLDAAARRAYLLPMVGLVTGAPAALLVLWGVLPAGISAVLVLALCLLAAGLHHADGVLDAGDALMVRGDPPRRLGVLRDARVGIGGLFALFVVYAPALAALPLLATPSLLGATAILGAEVGARSVMLGLLAFGEPATARSSTVPFAGALRGARRLAGVALALVLPAMVLIPHGPSALVCLGLLAATVPAVLLLCRSVFGGLTGDLVGASGEAARTLVLVTLAVAA